MVERLRSYRTVLAVHACLDRGVERPYDSTIWQTDFDVLTWIGFATT